MILEKDAEATAPDGIRLATFHRLKGLEFPHLILANVHEGVVPTRPIALETDPLAQARWERTERSLLYVAMTRARDHLTITGHGEASPLLP